MQRLRGKRAKCIKISQIILSDIPEEAYDYVINDKFSITWVMMEPQAANNNTSASVKAFSITNDANEWAIESMNNPYYPLELLQRVMSVSLETMKIVKGLPELESFGES